MRIAFIDYVLDPARPGASGLSDVVWNMARELAKLGDDVHVIGPYSMEPPMVPGITVHRFKVPPIGYRNIFGHVLIVLAAWHVARRIPDLDVIHAPEYLTTGILAPLSRTPIVLTTPGNIYERVANGNPFDPLTTVVLKAAARSSARWCRLIDAISSDMAQWWMRTGAAPTRLALIPYGVDTSVFRPIADAKTRLGIDETDQTILYAGRLSPEKHVAMLIRLLARIEHSQATLHILGTGPLESELQRMANELRVSNRVRFHGQVALEQMPLWYSAADLMILPSSSEGLPRVMLEALACGAPFIGTRITGIVDVIEDDKNGLLIDPGDDAALLTAAQSLLDNERFARDLGARALSDIRASYSWDSTVRQFRSAVVRETTLRSNVLVGEGR